MQLLDPREIPEGELVYAVVHEGHGLVDASPDLNTALAAAQRAAAETPAGCYVLDSAPPQRLVAANPAKSVRAALAATGLKRVSQRDVMKWNIEDALAEWSYLMPTERTLDKSQKVTIWQQADKVIGWENRGQGLLRDNFKMAKREGIGAMTYVLGLTLLPAESMFVGYLGGDRRRSLPISNMPKKGKTLCAYSTAECRSSCLTFSGRMTRTEYNVEVKQATTLALLNHTEPFLRVLVEACRNHLECPGRFHPYIRLNVLSDIPWELVAPWMFKMFKGKLYRRGKVKGRHAFYDYTKVPGRNTPSNYDLTYSYASTDPDRHAMAMRELQRGLRVAVVFLLPGKPKARREAPLPRTWLGHKVIDGDEHDVRPRNEKGVIVGLRYKSTSTVSEAAVQAGALSKFVIRPNPPPPSVYVVRVRKIDGMLVTDETPRQTGAVPIL